MINRLDDYFTSQQQADLDQRSKTVDTYVESLADASRPPAGPVVGTDGHVDPSVLEQLGDPDNQRFIADRLGQADVEITFGQYVADGESQQFVPAEGDPIQIPLEAPPEPGQTQERNVASAQDYGAGGRCSRRTRSRSRCPTRTRSGRPRWPTSPGCWPRSPCSRSG